jgi:hypothetical protein
LCFSSLDIYTITILISDKVGPKMAPICLFTYNRLVETRLTIESLKCNYLAMDSELTIFSDGPKNEDSIKAVQDVRNYLKTITGFKNITIIERDMNFGLAKSIITGVTQVINDFGSVIVLEDDLITSKNFLSFMNQSLKYYKYIDKVFSVSGFCLEIDKPNNLSNDAFFWGRAHSWGWATWDDRWATVDWSIADWSDFKHDRKRIKEFNSYGTDLFGMLRKSMLGKINSWYVRFNYNQFKQARLTVYPFESKVVNIGFTDSATHCDTYNRNSVLFDQSGKIDFEMPEVTEIVPSIRTQLFKYKSISYRIVGKLLTYLMKLRIIKQRVKGLVK